jgi:acetylornithine deacetylase/succinyl-diaminopimelate desuccinylase-like protein
MAAPAASSSLPSVLDAVDGAVDASLGRLFDFLKIPSISTDPAHHADCERAAGWLAGELEALGLAAEVRATGGRPAVVARSPSRRGRPRVLFYGHYDVQPVDPLDLWTTPPFSPALATLPDGRRAILGRGSSDDKGQVMTFVEALRAYRAAGRDLPVDITLLVEGEEEVGSTNLPAFLKKARKDLKADLALVCDTGMWDPKTPAITTSLRGLVYYEVTVKAANRDLHSGIYGGAAANPVHVLSRVIADLHDGTGRIAIPGFYKGVKRTPASVLASWRKLKLTGKSFLGPIGLARSIGEDGHDLIEHIQSRPTCDVNGIIGGYTGPGTKTVIAAQASAKVSFRLVGDQDPDAIGAAFETFVRRRIPKDCSVEFIRYKGSRAMALDYRMPALGKATAALADEWGRPAVTIGSGGSIPVVGEFKRQLGLDTLLVGFALDDDRIHSPNEKYDLQSFHKGIRSWVRILDALA